MTDMWWMIQRVRWESEKEIGTPPWFVAYREDERPGIHGVTLEPGYYVTKNAFEGARFMSQEKAQKTLTLLENLRWCISGDFEVVLYKEGTVTPL